MICFLLEVNLFFFCYIFFQCLKKAIMLASENHNYWNVLGVISMSKGN